MKNENGETAIFSPLLLYFGLFPNFKHKLEAFNLKPD